LYGKKQKKSHVTSKPNNGEEELLVL